MLPLDADTPVNTRLYGKGQNNRPSPSSGLAVTAPVLVNSYDAGDDVDVRWDWPSNQLTSAGAGLQGAGVAITEPPFTVDFVLEIRNAAGNFVERTELLTTNSFTYTKRKHRGRPRSGAADLPSLGVYS